MNRYELLNKGLSAVALATGVVSIRAAEEALSAYQLPDGVGFALSILVLAFCLVYLKVVLGHLVSAIPGLRRLLLGNQYVEGVWLNCVSTSTGKEIFGVINIEARGLSLAYGGENYARDGAHVGEFDSTLIEMTFPVMTFQYGASPSMAAEFSGGIIRITFHERPPVRFTAVGLDHYKEKPESIEAWKIFDEVSIQGLKVPATRGATVAELISKHFPAETAVAVGS